jgi:hypothetical protein
MGTLLPRKQPLTAVMLSASTGYGTDENDSRWNFSLRIPRARWGFLGIRRRN